MAAIHCERTILSGDNEDRVLRKGSWLPTFRPLQEAVTEMKRTAALLNTASLQAPLSERPCWRLLQDTTRNAKVFPKPSLVLSAAFTVSCGEGAGRECDAGDSRDRASCGPQQPMGF